MACWCDRGRTQRSCVGSLSDKAFKSSNRRAAEDPSTRWSSQRPATEERAPFSISGQQAARQRERRGRRTSSNGDRTVGVQLIESHVGRPQTISNNQTAAVPSLHVLVPCTLLRVLDPQSNGDKIDKRVQQQASARNDCWTLRRDGNRTGIRPSVGGA